MLSSLQVGVLSSSMKFIEGDWTEVSATLDGFAGAWNILDDSDFEESTGVCESVDHAHLAPPCRTLAKSRRTDEHGSVKVLRSEKHPEEWVDGEAVEANLIISRMVILCLLLHKSGATFSVENPWDSFLWQLRCMVKVMQIKTCELVLLHQCNWNPYYSMLDEVGVQFVLRGSPSQTCSFGGQSVELFG